MIRHIKQEIKTSLQILCNLSFLCIFGWSKINLMFYIKIIQHWILSSSKSSLHPCKSKMIFKYFSRQLKLSATIQLVNLANIAKSLTLQIHKIHFYSYLNLNRFLIKEISNL